MEVNRFANGGRRQTLTSSPATGSSFGSAAAGLMLQPPWTGDQIAYSATAQ